MENNLINLILSKVSEEAEQEENKLHTLGVYRASEIGGCHRALQYAVTETKAEAITPETYLIFKDGHMHHNAVRDLLKGIGTVSHIEFNLQKRYTYKDIKFLISGTIDLVFNGIVIDIKSISTFRFVGLSKHFPTDYMNYVIQLQLYMDMLNIEKGAILFKDKNSSELKIFHLKYNAALMESILESVARLHQACKSKKLIDRPYERNDWHCKLCSYRMACWRLPMEGKRWRQEPSKDAAARAFGKAAREGA